MTRGFAKWMSVYAGIRLNTHLPRSSVRLSQVVFDSSRVSERTWFWLLRCSTWLLIFSISISNSLHLLAKSFSAVGRAGTITGGSGSTGEGVCSGDVLDRVACK